MTQRAILQDVASAYLESKSRHDQYRARGQHDMADEFMSEMQEIEKSVQVIETNTGWRKTIAERRKREQQRAGARR